MVAKTAGISAPTITPAHKTAATVAIASMEAAPIAITVTVLTGVAPKLQRYATTSTAAMPVRCAAMTVKDAVTLAISAATTLLVDVVQTDILAALIVTPALLVALAALAALVAAVAQVPHLPPPLLPLPLQRQLLLASRPLSDCPLQLSSPLRPSLHPPRPLTVLVPLPPLHLLHRALFLVVPLTTSL